MALNARLNGSFRLDDIRTFGRVEVTQGTGWFTLVLRSTDQGWRILHDHSSEAPAP